MGGGPLFLGGASLFLGGGSLFFSAVLGRAITF